MLQIGSGSAPLDGHLLTNGLSCFNSVMVVPGKPSNSLWVIMLGSSDQVNDRYGRYVEQNETSMISKGVGDVDVNCSTV